MKTRIAITGVTGYSGRYIAREAERRGYEILGLTNSPGGGENPRWELTPLDWKHEDALADSMQGCRALINTYWVRFDHGSFSHGQAVENTRILFRAAKKAGVERVVHTSITHPDMASTLPYFRGKAQLEQDLEQLGIPYAILRPAVLFGATAAESILLNNMAWALRRLPLIGIPGDGRYRMQPIHVEDFASCALDAMEKPQQRLVIEAVGPETYAFRDLFLLMGRLLGCPRPVVAMPAAWVRAAASVLGWWQRDVLLTADEIRGLMEDRLAVDGAHPAGETKLSVWLREHADELGRSYASELARRRNA